MKAKIITKLSHSYEAVLTNFSQTANRSQTIIDMIAKFQNSLFFISEVIKKNHNVRSRKSYKILEFELFKPLLENLLKTKENYVYDENRCKIALLMFTESTNYLAQSKLFEHLPNTKLISNSLIDNFTILSKSLEISEK